MFAAGVPLAPLSPDAAYIGLVLPTPGDMVMMVRFGQRIAILMSKAGRLVDDDDALPPGIADDDDGLDGNSRDAISASVETD